MKQIDLKDAGGKTIKKIKSIDSERFSCNDETDSPTNLVLIFNDDTFSFIYPYSQDGMEYSPTLATRGYMDKEDMKLIRED